MIILRKENPILFAQVEGLNPAFYEEIHDIPKHVKKRMETCKNGGSGTYIDNTYFWGNTYGITSQKIFKRIRDGLILEPFNHTELSKINEFKTIEYVESILGGDTVFNVCYWVDCCHPTMFIRASYIISEDSLECNDKTEFVKYSELFRGRHIYTISIDLVVEDFIEEKYNTENGDISYKFMTLREFKESLNEFTVKSIDVRYNMCENKYFRLPAMFKFEDILTLSEAAEFCGKTEGAIRSSIKSGKLIEGKDWRKAGRITLITKKSIEKLYGKKE